HLQSVITQHDAVGDDLLKRRAVKERGGQYVQQVEPAAGLSDVFHDEVGRGVGIKPFLVLKWVVHLRKRHGTGIKPHVQHVWHTTHHRLTGGVIWVWTHQFINVWAVQRLWTLAKVTL